MLYVLLGIVSFALVAFFAWATWNGGKKEDWGPGGAPEQPTPPPPPPSASAVDPVDPTPHPTGRG